MKPDLDAILRERFGFPAFRPGQREAIEALFGEGRLICIQPTGHGKSMLYQLPATVFDGMTLVISPLLALMRDQLGQLQERITSTKTGSITSVQAIYVPADDYTDPGVATTFGHLDAVIALERSIAEQGLYPAVDPLTSNSRILDPAVVGEEHYQVARGVQEVLQRYKDLQDVIAILGMEELSDDADPWRPDVLGQHRPIVVSLPA